jgi:hypothetical protein
MSKIDHEAKELDRKDTLDIEFIEYDLIENEEKVIDKSGAVNDSEDEEDTSFDDSDTDENTSEDTYDYFSDSSEDVDDYDYNYDDYIDEDYDDYDYDN